LLLLLLLLLLLEEGYRGAAAAMQLSAVQCNAMQSLPASWWGFCFVLFFSCFCLFVYLRIFVSAVG